jgi:hypothetical protein
MIELLSELFFCGQTNCSISIYLFNNTEKILSTSLHYKCNEHIHSDDFIITLSDMMWFIENKSAEYNIIVHINPSNYAYLLHDHDECRVLKFPRFTPVENSNLYVDCNNKCQVLGHYIRSFIINNVVSSSMITIDVKIKTMVENKSSFLLMCHLTV